MPDRVAEVESLLVVCPADGALNRVLRCKLGADPKCGKCGRPLFAGKPVDLDAGNFGKHALKSDLPVVTTSGRAGADPAG